MQSNNAINLKWLYVVLLILVVGLYAVECHQNHRREEHLKRRKHISEEKDNLNNNNNRHHPKKGHRKKNRHYPEDDLSIWINEQQLKTLTALLFPQGDPQGRIYAIENGQVLNIIRESNIYEYLTIPAEVNYVNFTWKSGLRRYKYDFDILSSSDESILKAPTVSIDTQGRVPEKEKRPDPECDLKCGEHGFCNHKKVCQCNAGFTGQYCQTAFCFPQCLNGGNCTAPSVCTCPDGYQGTICEGGICSEKCLNGGKCIQKDKCQCSKGYYGNRCEFSKCVIPCKNGGRCIGTNKCRCPNGLGGDHCEIGRKHRSTTCKRPCKNGVCRPNKTCKCHKGFYGQFCNRQNRKKV